MAFTHNFSCTSLTQHNFGVRSIFIFEKPFLSYGRQLGSQILKEEGSELKKEKIEIRQAGSFLEIIINHALD